MFVISHSRNIKEQIKKCATPHGKQPPQTKPQTNASQTLSPESAYTSVGPSASLSLPQLPTQPGSPIVLSAASLTIWSPHYHTLRVHMGNL